jgi:hypothetical protein
MRQPAYGNALFLAYVSSTPELCESIVIDANNLLAEPNYSPPRASFVISPFEINVTTAIKCCEPNAVNAL